MDAQSEGQIPVAEPYISYPPFPMLPTYDADEAQNDSEYHQQFEPNDPLPQVFVPNMVSVLETELPTYMDVSSTFNPSPEQGASFFEPSMFKAVQRSNGGERSPGEQPAIQKAGKFMLAHNGAMSQPFAVEDSTKEHANTRRTSKMRGLSRPPELKPASEPDFVEGRDVSNNRDETSHARMLAKNQDRRRLPMRAAKAFDDTDSPNLDVGSSIHENIPKKRGRGRPPKVSPTGTEYMIKESNEVATRNQSRGVVSVAAIDYDEESEHEEPPKKRGPGRPRKSHISFKNDTQVTVVEAHDVDDEDQTIEEDIKRRSLRNRQIEWSLGKRFGEPPKQRGPGRPRKLMPETSATPESKKSTREGGMKTSAPHIPSRRRPGRPPKKRRGTNSSAQSSNDAKEAGYDVGKADSAGGEAFDERVIIALPSGYTYEDFIKAYPGWGKAGTVALGQVQEGGFDYLRKLVQVLYQE